MEWFIHVTQLLQTYHASRLRRSPSPRSQDMEAELKSRANVSKAASASYDSDGSDDDMPRGQRVQCARQ